jgi:hypothetical protein
MSKPGGKRGSYRDEEQAAIAAIEQRRKAAGVTFQELSVASGIAVATIRRMVRSGLGFPRQINALRMAMRTLERDRKTAEALFPGDPS